MHHLTPLPRRRLPRVRVLLGLLALTAGGLILVRSVWTGDVLEALLLQEPAPARAESKQIDVLRDFPSVEHPRAVTADEADLDDDTTVLGVSAGGRSRAYLLEAFAISPDSHIVNDVLGGVPLSVTHCNLSGCTRAFTDDWTPEHRDRPLDLSGGGFKTSQMIMKTGGHAYEQDSGRPLDSTSPPFPYREYQLERTSWNAWHKAHPDTDVYLGTIPPGTSIESEPATRSPREKPAAAVRVSHSGIGPGAVRLGVSVLLLLTGFAVLMPLVPRRVFWVLIVVVLLGATAVLLPDSPVSPAVLFERAGGIHNGHGTHYWLRALDSSDEELRHEAIFALGVLGSANPGVVPPLAAILADDPDAEARHCAALALLKTGPEARAAVPELAQALADEEPSVRMNAALVLAQLGTDARPAVPALIEAVERRGNRTNLGEFTFTIQEMAALALGRASAGSSVAVPVLTRFLKAARSASTRMGLASALGKVGAPARSAVPQLRALLSDDVPEVREAAAEALKSIEG